MYVIANRRTCNTLTSCLDRDRADRIARGFEQYVQQGAIRDDLNARDHYWHVVGVAPTRTTWTRRGCSRRRGTD